jgi:ABC-2 type transport system permease protein
MFRSFRSELDLLLADPRVRWIAAVLVLLMTASFALALTEARRTAQDATRMEVVERQRWLSQDPKNPHSAAHFGVWVFKPSPPLATLDPGVEPYVGRMVRIEAHRVNDAVFRSAQDRTTLARVGASSVADIVHLVVPLAVILLGFSAFAADRERGTLRLALGNGVPPGQLLGARFGALMLVTAVVVGAPALALGAIANLSIPSDGWQPWLRLPLWVGAAMAYAAVFLLIVLTASLLARTARGALAASLVAWTLLCVAAPRLSVAVIEAVQPTPSYELARERIDAAIKQYNRADLHQARQKAILARYGVTDPSALPIDLRGAMLHDREQHDYRVYDRELGAFNAQLARHDRLQAMAGVISPTIALQTLSEGLAGADFRRHADFIRAAEDYRRTLSDTMNLDLVAHAARGGPTYLAGREVWAKVPAFSYRPAPLGRALPELAAPAALLLLWLAAAAAAAIAVARRIQP